MIKLNTITIYFFFLISLLVLPSKSFAQDLLQNDKFSYAPLFNDQVVLIKEIPLKSNDMEKVFFFVKEWGKERYSTDPLISNIRYDNRNKEIIIKSKIELLLPENKNKTRDKVVMTYHLNTFILNNKCVFEVKGISYKLNNPKQILQAESTITQSALAKKDAQQELRKNIQLSTLFFFNEQVESLEKLLKSAD